MRVTTLLSLVTCAMAHLHMGKVPEEWMHAKPWAVEDWKIVEHGESFHTGPNGESFPVNTTHYVSPTIHLMTGEAFFSLNPFTHVPFPKGDYILLEADFTMVNAETQEKSSLAEVYNHHWLLGQANGFNVLEPCENNLFFGGGAEFRGMPLKDDGIHGNLRIGAKGYCGGNLHFIRTEDLATNWTGFNDPKGDYGAAVKNCIECGYAPGRAPGVCTEIMDGQFNCCFDGSRCPVSHPEDKTKKGYRLEYTVKWTTDLLVRKPTKGGVLDVGGGATEWNVAPHLDHPPSFPPVHQKCNDTVCITTKNFTVKKMYDTELGICPGTMYNSYLHQHTGSISGTMFVNGKEVCTSYPVIGTVPGTGPESVGNEKGYCVSFHSCLDKFSYNTSVRLNEGDVITITGLYDVDVNSTRNAPITGGKHGGIMMLYFYSIDCDPGTYPTQYVCRQNKCLEAPKGDFKTEASCKQTCGHDSGNTLV
jgi:hypothetical protein